LGKLSLNTQGVVLNTHFRYKHLFIGIKYWDKILTEAILVVKPLQVLWRIKGTRFTWKRELVKKLGTFSVTEIPVELGLPELM
jgi:hypothetical protein